MGCVASNDINQTDAILTVAKDGTDEKQKVTEVAIPDALILTPNEILSDSTQLSMIQLNNNEKRDKLLQQL